MLKRRLDCSQNPATPADLRKDIWKAKENALRLMHPQLRRSLSIQDLMALKHRAVKGNVGASLNQFCKKYLSYGQGAGTMKKPSPQEPAFGLLRMAA